MKQFYVGLVVLAALVTTAVSLCSHPCSRVNRGTFTDGTNEFVFGCRNTSVLKVYTPDGFLEDRECYARSGAFLVFRVGNSYQCFKDTVYDSRTNVVIIYFSARRSFRNNPSICEVCSGPLTVAVFVAKGQDIEAAKKIRPPRLGCNRPPNCPVIDRRNDKPCTGCEPKEDDGLCCSSCRRYRKKSGRKNGK